MIAEPGQYKDAVELMAKLRLSGIECGETQGGVKIYPSNPTQRSKAEEICNGIGVHFHDGEQSFAADFRDAMRAERQR